MPKPNNKAKTAGHRARRLKKKAPRSLLTRGFHICDRRYPFSFSSRRSGLPTPPQAAGLLAARWNCVALATDGAGVPSRGAPPGLATGASELDAGHPLQQSAGAFSQARMYRQAQDG
jgi:hypothetical protein